MNWMLIVAILLVSANMVWGYRQGFLRTVYRMFQWLLILVCMTWATPYVSDYLMEHTAIAQTIQQRTEEKIQQMVDESVESPQEAGGEEVTELSQLFPPVLMDDILEKTGVYETVSQQVTRMIIDGISYLLVLVLTFILLRVIDRLLGIIEKIPLIEGVNRIFGVLLGALKGVLFLWIFMAIVACFAGTSWGSALVLYMSESVLLEWMYENNYLLQIILLFL